MGKPGFNHDDFPYGGWDEDPPSQYYEERERAQRAETRVRHLEMVVTELKERLVELVEIVEAEEE